MRVLVTGGAGYIGSHAVRALSRSGHQPLVLDNLVYGHADIVREALGVPLINGQVGDLQLIEPLLRGQHPELIGTPFEAKPIEAVLHFAAYAYVAESVSDPAKYYRNNLGDTLTLLEALVANEQPIPIVFSSTCATYGFPDKVPITEDTPQRPVNPYGEAKLMFEKVLLWYEKIYGIQPVFLRYFNACGATEKFGEDHEPETHLIPNVIKVALKQQPHVNIFGNDYDTPDGTCIRDYIHIVDLGRAHILALTGNTTGPFNLGTGKGFSVREVIDVVRKVTKRDIPEVISPRRPGDPDRLVASAVKAKKILKWTPLYSNLNDIVESAWGWHQAHPDGYKK